MKKIVSRQIPNARIARPLTVAAGLLISIAAGGTAEAQTTPQDIQNMRSGTDKALDIIRMGRSGDQGCVVGAGQQQQEQQRQQQQQQRQQQEQQQQEQQQRR